MGVGGGDNSRLHNLSGASFHPRKLALSLLLLMTRSRCLSSVTAPETDDKPTLLFGFQLLKKSFLKAGKQTPHSFLLIPEGEEKS